MPREVEKKKGRPTKITPEVMAKMEEAAAIDASWAEMAYYCNVTRQTIDNWLKLYPELAAKIERLREKPVLKARNTIVAGLGDPDTAKWYLSRKRKKEFAERIEKTGAEGGPVEVDTKVTQEEHDSVRQALLASVPEGGGGE